jgi:hypothetical protein
MGIKKAYGRRFSDASFAAAHQYFGQNRADLPKNGQCAFSFLSIFTG